MAILDFYIVRQHIAPFLFGIAVFTGVFVGTDVLYAITNLMVEYGTDLGIVIRLFFLHLPEILVLALPMAALLSTILTISRMNREGEITAIRTSGVSFFRLILPVLVAALFLGGVNILFNETIVPTAQLRVRELTHYARFQEELPLHSYNLHIAPLVRRSNQVDYIFYAHYFDGHGYLEGVVLQDFQGGHLETVIKAERAHWEEDRWIFYDGQIVNIFQNGRAAVGTFARYEIPGLERTPTQLSMSRRRPRELSMGELREIIALYREENRDVREYLVVYHQRWAIPLASFIMVLLAAPLAIKPTRAGTSLGMGISAFLIFTYYVLMTIGAALGEGGYIPPFWGAWIQNVIFGGIGLFLMYRTDGQVRRAGNA